MKLEAVNFNSYDTPEQFMHEIIFLYEEDVVFIYKDPDAKSSHASNDSIFDISYLGAPRYLAAEDKVVVVSEREYGDESDINSDETDTLFPVSLVAREALAMRSNISTRIVTLT